MPIVYDKSLNILKEGRVRMTNKERIIELLNQIPESEVWYIIDYFENVVVPDILSDDYSTDPYWEYEATYDSTGKRIYTVSDIEYLPDFMRIELMNGVMTGHQDFVTIEVDDEVFSTKPTITHPITYRVSILKNE